ncbi:MAG: hypothetical protein IT233_07720 [Bacteroidia bacterium]|nr:hypothetical protein [Bacteroidia bacterium]
MNNEQTQTYEHSRIERIRMSLVNAERKGNPTYYDIWVDGVKVVDRTTDLNEFSRYEEFIYPDTRKITINVYTASPTSPHITGRHHFTFGEEEKRGALNGFGLGEIQEQIREKVSQERERWECDQVKKDLTATKEKLSEAEEYIGQLQDIIEDTKTKLTEAKGMGEIASAIKDLALPHLFGKKSEDKSLSGNEKPQEEASFKMKPSDEEAASEEDQFFIGLGRNMKASFTEEEFNLVLSVIREFSKDKSNIIPVTQLLNIQPLKKQTNAKV